MATYISTINFTEQGVKAVGDTTKRDCLQGNREEDENHTDEHLLDAGSL